MCSKQISGNYKSGIRQHVGKYDRQGKSQRGPYKEVCWLTKVLKFFEGITKAADRVDLVYIIIWILESV